MANNSRNSLNTYAAVGAVGAAAAGAMVFPIQRIAMITETLRRK